MGSCVGGGVPGGGGWLIYIHIRVWTPDLVEVGEEDVALELYQTSRFVLEPHNPARWEGVWSHHALIRHTIIMLLTKY